MHTNLVIAGIFLLAVGTFAMRFAGYRLGSRLPVSERVRNMLSDTATILLLAVAVTTALFEGPHFAGAARVTGVLFALFLAWRRVPLILVIVGAALMTALLRYIGLP